MDVFNEIPESLSDLSADDLRTLRDRLRDAGLSLAERAKAERLSAEDMENARTARRVVGEIDAELAQRDAEADEVAEIEAALTAEAEDEADEVAEELSDESDDGEDDDGEEGDEEDDGEDEVTEAVTAAVAPTRTRARPSAAALANDAPATPAPITPERVPELFRASAGVSGYIAGEAFESMEDLSKALVTRWNDIKGGASEKMAVATMEGHFDPDNSLMSGESARFSADPESLQAGINCVPRENLYDVGCASSEARPVANSLGNRRAPRGGYSQYPSPMLADVTDEVDNQGDASGSGDGTGIWTREDDGDPNALKAACAVIPCGTPQDWDIYGVYRCITVRNLHAMAHPELVAAYLNKLGALWARLADTALLDAMATARATFTNVTADLTGEVPISANTRLLDTIVQAVGVWREQERYDSVDLQAWTARWVQVLLIRDWLYRSRYDESNPAAAVIGQGEVSAALRDAGINITWTLDVASDWEAIGTQGDGDLIGLPTQVDMVLTPPGNFQRLDEGNLTVGVTNRVPWDLDDMRRNQFTMFWESYEGLLDLGCPSWGLSIGPLCPTGLQYAGVDPGVDASVVCEAGS